MNPKINRRHFMTAAGISLAPGFVAPSYSNELVKPKRVLVLGGTRYLGPVIVDELLSRGYSVTLFNRGKTNPGLFPDLPLIKGDREIPNGEGLQQLANNNQQWDWVVDTWRGSSKAVEDTARLLAGRTGQYQYVSTVSVYDKWDSIGIIESAPLNPLPADFEPIISPYRYAIRKTFAEKVLNELLPNNSIMFRSHGLRGYPTSAPRHEPYWQVKVKRGDQLVVPADVEYYQVTDMRSLAQFMIYAGERKLNGPYNVAYPSMRFHDFIQRMITATRSKVTLHRLPQEFLLAHDAKLIRTVPAGRYRFDVSKALKAGLQNRPLETLLADQLRGYFERHPNDDFKFGQPDTSTISELREKELLALWQLEKENDN